MSFDIGYIFGSTKNIFTEYFGETIKSTFWTSILIIIVITFILMIMYPTKKRESFRKLFKPIIYIFLSILIILFVHDSCILDNVDARKAEEEVEKTIGGIKELHNREIKSTNIYDVLYPEAEGNRDDIGIRKHKQIGPLSIVDIDNKEKGTKEEIGEKDDAGEKGDKDGKVVDTKL